MDVAINRFIFILKGNGVHVSPSETIDALRALAYVTINDREIVRTTLCSTLIKNERDIPLFNDLFDIYFNLPGEGNGHHHYHHGHDHSHDPEEPEEPQRIVVEPDEKGIDPDQTEHAHGEPADVREYFDPEKIVTMFNPHQDPNRLSLSAMTQHLILNRNKGLMDRVMKKMTHQLKTRRVKNVSQTGDLTFGEGLEYLDLDLVANAAWELLDNLVDMEVDEALVNQLASQIDGLIANLPELLKEYIEREMALRGDEAVVDEHIHSAYDYRFTERERREMEEIIRRMGRQMRGALSHRRFISNRGRINVAHTLRRSMQYDGIPFQPVVVNRREERPRIVVICDVSLSVRNTARFMLHLVHSMQTLFEQVRSFAFVSDLVEVSPYFEHASIDTAIGMIFNGEVIDADANSNYGHALQIFHDQHLSAITNRTTVIILGDGRGNRNPPNAWVLERIRQRARQLIWLNPEPRGSWGLGSSDMPLYEPICHRVEVVRNLKQLGQVTEELVRRSAAVPAFR